MNTSSKDPVVQAYCLLVKKAMNVSELSDELGVNWRTARNYVNTLMGLGLVTTVEGSRLRSKDALIRELKEQLEVLKQ